MARLLQRFLLAVATVLLFSSSASSPGAVAISAPAIAESVAAEAGARVRARQSSHHVQDGSSHRPVDLKAVEIDADGDDDDDDDDDARRDCAHVAALGLRCVPVPRRPDRDLRGELQADTSRFTAGTGLPRGPPARSAPAHTTLPVDRS